MNTTSGSFFRRLWKTALYFFAGIPLWLNAADFSSQFISRTWQTDDGLPHNTIQAITQTTDGYLWVGTREGLARFDGHQFVVFDAKNTPEIKGRLVFALCAARDGSLWIGFDDGGGVTRWKDGKFRHYG